MLTSLSNSVDWIWNGGGSPLVWVPYPIIAFGVYTRVYDVAAADVGTPDGAMDVIACAEKDLVLFLNAGLFPPTWTPVTIFRGTPCVSVQAMDGACLQQLSSLYPFTFPVTTMCFCAFWVRVVDGDGLVDIVTASPQVNWVQWYKNGGGPSPTWTPNIIGSDRSYPYSVALADVDGDGRVDVLSSAIFSGTVDWFKNGGGAPTGWALNGIASLVSAYFVQSADVDGDGRVDVLAASADGNKAFWYQRVDQLWAPRPLLSSAFTPFLIQAADITGDGDAYVDLIVCYSARISVYVNSGLCGVGTAGVLGQPPCTPCEAGRYSSAIGSHVCAPCPEGRFGADPGGTSAGAACTGTCGAGYSCPPGTAAANATASVCPAGTFSTEGAGSCSQCAAGLYGGSPGAVSPQCSGLCAPGFFCTSGSTNNTPSVCPAGQYSMAGAGQCSDCSSGQYGSTPGLQTPDCTGPCTAGYACPAGSVNATVTLCPAGTYSTVGSSVCTPCVAGLYGDTPGLPLAACTGPCPAGRFGSVSGLTSATCTGACDAGYACTPGSISATQTACPMGRYSLGSAGECTVCPGGTFGVNSALRTADCTGLCTAGYSCLPGSVSSTASICQVGYVDDVC